LQKSGERLRPMRPSLEELVQSRQLGGCASRRRRGGDMVRVILYGLALHEFCVVPKPIVYFAETAGGFLRLLARELRLFRQREHHGARVLALLPKVEELRFCRRRQKVGEIVGPAGDVSQRADGGAAHSLDGATERRGGCPGVE
jgi:hypothetical protein